MVDHLLDLHEVSRVFFLPILFGLLSCNCKGWLFVWLVLQTTRCQHPFSDFRGPLPQPEEFVAVTRGERMIRVDSIALIPAMCTVSHGTLSLPWIEEAMKKRSYNGHILALNDDSPVNNAAFFFHGF